MLNENRWGQTRLILNNVEKVMNYYEIVSKCEKEGSKKLENISIDTTIIGMHIIVKVH